MESVEIRSRSTLMVLMWPFDLWFSASFSFKQNSKQEMCQVWWEKCIHQCLNVIQLFRRKYQQYRAIAGSSYTYLTARLQSRNKRNHFVWKTIFQNCETNQNKDNHRFVVNDIMYTSLLDHKMMLGDSKHPRLFCSEKRSIFGEKSISKAQSILHAKIYFVSHR